MTYHRSASGLAHRTGNLRKQQPKTACGHHFIGDLEPFDGEPEGLRCWSCYRK